MGDVADAEREAREALDLGSDDIQPVTRRRARGADSRAGRERRVRRSRRGDAAARPRRPRATRRPQPLPRDVRLRARLRRGVRGRRGRRSARAREPDLPSWRSTAAVALAHLGRRDEAAALADAEIARAERFGAPLPLATGPARPRGRRERRRDADRALPARARHARRLRAVLDLGPHPARARQHAAAQRFPRACARGATPGARRRRRRRCRAARQARPARAGRDRHAPAPRRDRGRRVADAAPASDLLAGRRRPRQPRDRPRAVPQHQDRRDPPRRRLPQARHQLAGRAERRARRGAGR